MAVTIMRTIRPSPQWQDSLIRVKREQRIVVDAEETWSPDMRDQIAWCGADGLYKFPAGQGYHMPGTNVGALIARIDDGEAFAVGARCDFICKEEGVLFFAMNEHAKHNNQAGKVVAQIIVFEAEQA